MSDIRKIIDGLIKLLDEADDLREQLIAKGIQTQTINVLVEMGFHENADSSATLVQSALDAAQQVHGTAAITQQELTEQVEMLVVIEQDIAHQRRAARQKGLDLQALNYLARTIRENPGDGGVKAVNHVLGYAQACGIELTGISQVIQQSVEEPASVLPQIARESDESSAWAHLFRDISLGLLFTAVLMTLMVS